MKNLVKKYISVLLLLCISAISYAQTSSLSTGYFLEGNLYRYRLNPAFMGVRGYFSLPAAGNVSINASSDLGLANFIYPTSDGSGLVTFLHPDVSIEDFNSSLSDKNRISASADINIISFGYFGFGGYNTFDIGLHSNVGLNIPRDMFLFMKDMGHERYEISDLSAYTRNYVDIAFGHSHKVTRDLTIGARLKVLLGVAYAELLMEKMEMEMSNTKWLINAKGSAAAAAGLKLSYDENGVYESMDGVKIGLNGLGFGVDLGAVYDLSNVLTKGLVVSASVNDISYMSWKNVAKAGLNPAEPYVFDGFEAFGVGEKEGEENTSLNAQFEQIGEDLSDFFALKDQGVADKTEFFGATLNIGVEYKMPFYSKMSVGALFSNRFDKLSPYTKGSLMLNISPLKVFDFAVSGTASTYGMGWGAMINFHCPGFNLFLGADSFVGKLGKQYIPLGKTNTSVSLGVNIPFRRK